MNNAVRALLAVIIGLVAVSGASDRSESVDEHVEPASSVGDDVLYDVIARANESVLANIDAADLALLAAFAAPFVVVVFGIDKITELASPWRYWSIGTLGASALFCILGFVFWRPRETIAPSLFVIDFASDPSEAIATATEATVSVYGTNIHVREAKRWFVILAIGLLLAGTVEITVARLVTSVVHCERGTFSARSPADDRRRTQSIVGDARDGCAPIGENRDPAAGRR